jgi:hypothetical protein
MLFAAAAGTVFGLQSALLRTITVGLERGVLQTLTSWHPYALAVVGTAGMLCGQSAFQAGQVTFSLPIIDMLESSVAILIGAVAFGERLTNTPLAIAIEIASAESAAFIATRMWNRFVSATAPDPATWAVATLRALQLRPSTLPAPVQHAVRAGLVNLGQVPFDPPNDSGWPSGSAWLTTAAARLSLAQTLTAHADLSAVTSAARSARIEATTALLSLPSLSDRTRAALEGLTANPPQPVALPLASPENVVSP